MKTREDWVNLWLPTFISYHVAAAEAAASSNERWDGFPAAQNLGALLCFHGNAITLPWVWGVWVIMHAGSNHANGQLWERENRLWSVVTPNEGFFLIFNFREISVGLCVSVIDASIKHSPSVCHYIMVVCYYWATFSWFNVPRFIEICDMIVEVD